uniref:F-box domain-containing protein n=1 Tax=Ciona savignyi TaxID=51511 RepID=H2ZC80_CIOSA
MDVTLTQDCMQINLPEEMVLKIFGLLSYEDVAKVRLVCKQMNIIACSHLNSGFNAAQDELSKTIKQVKDGLPRRESERRKHHLYPKHDALIGLDTRLSLLRMTYIKYIMAGMTCFIPGRVLDEFFLVLKKIKTLPQLPSTCKLLQEMRDISSMAIEHFDDVISPRFQKSLNAHFSLSFRNNSVIDINDFWHESQVEVPQKTHNSNFKKLSWKVGKCRSLQNRSTLSMKKVVSKQRAELQQLKSMMSKKNKQVQNLKSTVSTQEKTLKEVQSQ